MHNKKERVYLVSPYYPDENGNMLPALPDVCPCHYLDNKPCRLSNDHDRDRKTGPCFPLRVLHCGAHGISFTVYPPGHFPWGRQSIAPIEADGSQIASAPDEQKFSGTYFDAALDAKERILWPNESTIDSLDPRYTTQIRHIERAAILLGIEPALDENSRAIIAQVLNVPGQLVSDHVALIRDNSGYQIKGEAVCTILDAFSTKKRVFERLATVGNLVGLWPKLSLWDDRYHVLRQPSFHKFRTRDGPP